MDFDVIVQLLIRFSAHVRYWKEIAKQYISYLSATRMHVTRSVEKCCATFP
jgi:hypothetical protein